jgi:hypothetical protein
MAMACAFPVAIAVPGCQADDFDEILGSFNSRRSFLAE